MDEIRCLAQHALRLRVAYLADVHDGISLASQSLDQVMGTDHVAAGGIDHVQALGQGSLLDLGGDSVGGKNYRPFGDLIKRGQT
jgi:hypothetical protein